MRAVPSKAWVAVAALSLSACNLFNFWRPLPADTYTPVFAAAGRGDVAAVRMALDRQPRLLQTREQDRQTLLHEAVSDGQVGMARFLVSRGARLDARTGGGLTPLHLAAQNGDVQMMELLVGSGARVNVKDHQGRTPLDQAATHNHPDAIQWLGEHGGRTGSRQSEPSRSS